MDNDMSTDVAVFKKGAYITVEGRKEDRFFIIHEGQVQIFQNTEVFEGRNGKILGPGNFFGVVASMTAHAYIETVIAITDVTVIVVNMDQFESFIHNHSETAMEILSYFASHVGYLINELARLTILDKSEINDASFLFNVGEYFYELEKYNQSSYAYLCYLKYCPTGKYVENAKTRLNGLLSYASVPLYTSDGNKRVYAEESVIYAQGEPGKEFYVLQSGSVRVIKIANNTEMLVATHEAGDIFGDVAVLSSVPRTVTAITNEPCEIIAINSENLPSLVDSNPLLIKHLMNSLSKRAWFFYEQLANARLTDPVARMYGALLTQLKKRKVSVKEDRGYKCDFGMQELIAFTGGLLEAEAEEAVQEFLTNPQISIVNGNIFIANLTTLKKNFSYYKSVERRKTIFQQSQYKTV